MNQSVSEGLTLLHNKINDVITSPDRNKVLGSSQLVYLNFTTAAQIKSPSFKDLTLVERDAFFIINNTNDNLYEQLNSFIP